MAVNMPHQQQQGSIEVHSEEATGVKLPGSPKGITILDATTINSWKHHFSRPFFFLAVVAFMPIFRLLPGTLACARRGAGAATGQPMGRAASAFTLFVSVRAIHAATALLALVEATSPTGVFSSDCRS